MEIEACNHPTSEMLIWSRDCSFCWMKPIVPISSEKSLRMVAKFCFESLSKSATLLKQQRLVRLMETLDLENRRIFFSEIPEGTLNLIPDIARQVITAVSTSFRDSMNGLIWCSRLEHNTFKFWEYFNVEDDFLSECKVCFQSQPDWVFLQCGHSICQECNSKIQECPFCRREIVFHVGSHDVSQLIKTRRSRQVIFRKKVIPLTDFLIQKPSMNHAGLLINRLTPVELKDYFYKSLTYLQDHVSIKKDVSSFQYCVDLLKAPPLEELLMFITLMRLCHKEWDPEILECFNKLYTYDQVSIIKKLTLGSYFQFL